MVKPKPMSESDVRITDINVRSALIRVRWKDIPVRRAASSVAISPDDDSDVTRLLGAVAKVLTPPVGGRRAASVVDFAHLRRRYPEVGVCSPLRGPGSNSETSESRRWRQVEPDSAPIRACDSRRAHDPNGVTDRFHRSRGNDDDRDRLDGECDRMSDRIKDRFHPRSTHPVTGGTRT